MKPKIVLSGVSVRESGALVLFRDALTVLEREYGDEYDIVALVKSRELFDTPRVTYIEFPRIMYSWLARLHFEYWSARSISAQLKPRLWISMSETTPSVRAEIRAVYCHNVSEFYNITRSEFLLDWRFGMFTRFFRFIHRINIHENQYVIVQADWIRKRLARIYALPNIVVAHPEMCSVSIKGTSARATQGQTYRFYYPAYPRPYKNFELCLTAAQILERQGFNKFELWLTLNDSTNKYASRVVRAFPDVQSVRWLGFVPRERVMELYEEADCLLFPSRLEAWGVPISEFRCFGKPILVADLPYAHETTAGYDHVRFFDPDDPDGLADLMLRAAKREAIFNAVPDVPIDQPYAGNWGELWTILLNSD